MVKSYKHWFFVFAITASLVFSSVTPVKAVAIPAEINKQFTPISIDAGGVSVLRVTIFNPNTFPLTNATWTDNLVGVQPGLSIANPAGVVTNNCGGSPVVTAVPGTTTFSLSNASVPAQVGSTPGECYVEVNVTSTTPGNLINTIPAHNPPSAIGLTADGNDGGTPVVITNTSPASATITVIAVTPPSLTKGFSPNTIFVGETSQLTITINNQDTNTNLTNTSYTDTLPSGVVLASPVSAVVTGCGAYTLNATPGGTTVQLTNATVAPSPNCVVQVNVTGSMGQYTNTIPAGPGGPGSIVTNQGVTNGSPASAPLNIQPIGLIKDLTPSSIVAGGTSTLTITLQNPTGSPYTGVNVTDNLPAGLQISGTPTTTCLPGVITNTATSVTLTGGTVPASATPPTPLGTCTITATVLSPLTTTPATLTNTIPANAITAAQPGVTNYFPATDTIVVTAPLTGTKAYSPTSIVVGGVSTVTITLTNNSATNLTGVNFTDTLPANLTVSGTPATPQCGGGTITNTATSVTLAGGAIPATSSCTIVFNVTSTVPGSGTTYENTIPANNITTAQGVGNANTIRTGTDLTVVNSATLPVGVGKVFQTSPIAPGDPTRLRITITAPADTNLTGLNIVDTLPAGLVVVGTGSTPPAPANPVDTCTGATVVAPIGGNTISLSGASITAGNNCTITVYVTSSTPGTYNNIIPATTVTTNEGRTNDVDSNTATVVVTSLSVSKAFYPDTVQANGLSTLTITLENTTNSPLINVSTTDNFPGTPTNGIVVAPIPNASTTCGAGVITANPGTQTVSMTGGTIPAQVGAVPGICTITVDVQGTDSSPASPATRTNIILATNVTGTVQSTGTTINAIYDIFANLNIQPLTIGAVKGFNPVLVYGSATSTMTVQLNNPNNATLTGIAFTDNMALLAPGIVLANPVNFNVGTCGGTLTGNPGDSSFSFSGGTLLPNSSCSITLSVVMQVNGNRTNRIPAGAVTTFNGVSSPDDTEASLTNLPGVSVVKVFNPDTIIAGQPSTLTITIDNTNSIPVVDMSLTDSLPGVLPTGLEIANPPNATTTCGDTTGTPLSLTATAGTQPISLVGAELAGNSSCIINVDVTSSQPGVYINTIPANAITSQGGITNPNPTTATLTVNPNVFSLGNRVWFDTDNSATINGTEVGIDGVDVQLYAADGSGNPTGAVLQTDTTTNGGYYRFDNLPAGDYVVVIPASEFGTGGTLDGYLSSSTSINGTGTISETAAPDPDNNTDSDDNGTLETAGAFSGAIVSEAVTLDATPSEPTGETDIESPNPSGEAVNNQSNLTVDFGFYRMQIGNQIYEDVNSNGTYDAGDADLIGANVRLYSGDGLTEIPVGPDGILGTTDDALGGMPSNGTGQYLFGGLPAGNYVVGVTPPAGYASTIDTANSSDSGDPNINANDNDNGLTENSGQVFSNDVTLTPGSFGALSSNNVTNSDGTTYDPTLDFGFVTPTYSLGNRVWFDTDNNGLINGTEVGVSGVRAELYVDTNGSGVFDAGDTFQSFTTTDSTGYYRFDNLPAGNYIVVLPADNFRNVGVGDTVAGDPLANYWSSLTGINISGVRSDATNVITNDPDTDVDDSDDNGVTTFNGSNVVDYVSSSTVTLGPGTNEPTGETDLATSGQGALDNRANMTVDFGFYQVEIGDLIFVDANNNGTYDAGDSPLSGAVVRLFSSDGTEILVGGDGVLGTSDDSNSGVTTGVSGLYEFSGLPDGDYIVRVTPPAGYASTIDTADQSDNDDPDVNTDNNDNGDGTGSGTVSSAVLTMDAGEVATNITVTNSTGVTNDSTVDFGFVLETYSLGNRVWFDTNNNGLIEIGTEVGVSGVRVELYQDTNGSGVFDAGDTFQSFATTDATGYYRFDNLAADSYIVVIPEDNFRNVGVGDTVAGDPLANYWSSLTSINTSGVRSDATDATTNDPDADVDDSDDNGVTTFNVGNNINYVASSAVDLGPSANEPAGETDLSGTGQGTADNRANMTVDFGFYQNQIGDIIFADVNTNGTYDAGDSPLSGATVRLYSSNGTEILVGGDGVLGTSDDGTGGMTTTGTGFYRFSGLPDGDYIIQVTPPSGSGYTSTIDTFSSADNADPDTNVNNNDNGIGTGSGTVSSGILTMDAGEVAANISVTQSTGITDDSTVDFGFVTPLYSLGNRVWFDTDNSSTLNGTEVGINGVTVQLYAADLSGNPIGAVLQTDTTTNNGYYRFDNLPAGDYVVVIPASQFTGAGALVGYWSSGTSLNASGVVSETTAPDPDVTVTDSDDNGTRSSLAGFNGAVISSAVTLESTPSEPTNDTDAETPNPPGEAVDNQSNRTVDFGFYRQTLGDIVFVDVNSNGVYDAGDLPLSNATVQLYSSNGTEIPVGPDGILGTSDDTTGGITTGVGGTYLFNGLPAGDYFVRVTPPAGSYTSTIDSANSADNADPDGNIDDNDNGIGTANGAVSSGVVTLTPGGVGAATNNTVTDSDGTTANPTIDFGFLSTPGFTKSIIATNEAHTTGNNVAIGEIVTYEVVIEIPQGVPFNNVTVTDQMDLGLAFVDCVSVFVLGVDQTATVCPPTVTPAVGSSANPADDGRNVVFTIGNVNATAPNQTITIQYRAIVLDVIENQENGQLNNSVTWAWDNGSQTTSAPNVQIVEPDLSIDKSALPTTNVAIGTPVQFTLVIDHTTPESQTDAFDVVVSDILPANLEYVQCSVTYTAGLAPDTPASTYCNPGNTTTDLIFEWATFPLGATSTITFNARLIGTPAINSASVAWTSIPIDPQLQSGLPVILSTFNNESTERWYDPLDDVNVYGVSDSVTINSNEEEEEQANLPSAIPATGFAPNQVTILSEQPKEKDYASTSVVLEIPRLGVKIPIVGVPLVDGDWDVSWLVQQAGWLQGTAFPSWQGNSVLTSHVTLADGTDGPFAQLGKLKWGDRIIVHAYGTKFIYEVRQNRTISPSNMTVFEHEEEAWLTLITCKNYNETAESYLNRIAIRAVLIDSVLENTYFNSEKR